MIARSSGKGFLSSHWEWLAVGAAVVALVAACLMFANALGTDPEVAAGCLRRIDANGAKPCGVDPADMSEYSRLARLVRNPAQVAAVTEREASFLASERRVMCKACRFPMPGDAAACPSCGAKVEVKEEVAVDADGDGLPDEWERKYSLNPADASDADADADGDGFSNKEEFEAGTDPSDASSHPDYLDFVKLSTPLKATTLPFFFERAMPLPSGVKFYFKDPKKRNDYGQLGTVYSVREGEKIGQTGFVARKYERKVVRRKIKGSADGLEREVDQSTAEVERESDGKTVKLLVGDSKRAVPVDIKAKLVYAHGEQREFEVVPGDSIEIFGSKYKVKSIDREGKKARVALEHVVSGNTRVIEALEP